jgi:hypothetical protein
MSAAVPRAYNVPIAAPPLLSHKHTPKVQQQTAPAVATVRKSEHTRSKHHRAQATAYQQFMEAGATDVADTYTEVPHYTHSTPSVELYTADETICSAFEMRAHQEV